MKYSFEKTKLWSRTLGKNDSEDIERLRGSFFDFRKKIEPLVKNIEVELPGLTIHDITHIDSLWDVADQIIGDKSYLNPMEAYILGGAFLLHDAAHVNVAYEGGFGGLKKKDEWKDLVSLWFDGVEPEGGSEDERKAFFQIIRQLHANQARSLINRSWKSEASHSYYFLISDEEIRNYYSELIGEIAESHHWSSKKVYETFLNRKINAPGFLTDAGLEVDALKIAFLLRTADAAHIDSRRAPIYSYNYMSPKGVSKTHWHFQNKLGRVTLSDNQSLRISSGSSFSEDERSSWWLAFDTAKMINNELQDALNYLSDAGREPFTAIKVLGVDSPKNFSKYVKADGWEPEDISIHVSNLPRLISTLGGRALYGENNYVGIRELIQNGLDAVVAARNLGYLDDQEGLIGLKLEKNNDNSWRLSITDNGLGMSRYVLSNILLDFGKSLWSDDDIRYEHPRLAQTGFSSIGQFGIGFYSVFMLSNQVTIITNRYKSKLDENNTHWKLTFQNGLTERPFISRPSDQEQLKKHGTMVSFIIDDKVFLELLSLKNSEELYDNEKVEQEFVRLIKWILPTCEIDISLFFNGNKKKIITANDWVRIPDDELLSRLDDNNVKGSLYPVVCNGNIVARLRIADLPYFYRTSRPHASVTYKGARAGDVYGLHGVCISHENNGKAERNDAIPYYTLESWRDWALNIVRSEPKLSKTHLLRLHILIPDEDLYVWSVGEDRCSINDIKEFLSTHNEFYSMNGSVDYEEDDEVKNSEFDDYFSLNENIIIVPLKSMFFGDKHGEHFDDIIKSMTTTEINYRVRLEDILISVWGDFESDEEYRVVGDVNGADITRHVIIYKKS
ncbi:ATP-binding protein [Aeromonas hydrophila]|uniref:HD domain-containing protein n=1 Tax=Aeromonas hydrophila TaxID=644 RepID=UPI001F4BFB85|nr:ATP-binding protein [Aeromonas hydrophila]MCO4201304.1 ATP-binding protein [Aeromonas hydrophila]UNB59043.1 ATP-binding protein [Aeromonas hydrophila]